MMVNFKDPNTYHDRVLVVGEVKFYVVSGVLSLWSEYFRGMFNGNFKESEKKEIKLEELNSLKFHLFLEVLHQQERVKLQDFHIVPLIDLAYRFLAPKVLEFCKNAVEQNLNKIDNIMLELLQKTIEYGVEDLKKVLVNHVSDPKVIEKSPRLLCSDIQQIVRDHKHDKKWRSIPPAKDFMNTKISLDFTDPQMYHDRVLLVGETKFYVVSGVLALWAEYFCSFFIENAGQFEIKIEDLDPNEFLVFLEVLYRNKSAELKDHGYLLALMDQAVRFSAQNVLAVCEEYIYTNIKNLDYYLLDLFEKACIYKINDLKKILIRHVTKEWDNGDGIVKPPDLLRRVGKYQITELKEKIINMVSDWKVKDVSNYGPIIELVKCAYKHDVSILKKKLRLAIFQMVRKKSNNVGDKPVKITVNAFLEDNYKEIMALPEEMRDFVIHSTFNLR